MLPQQPSNGQTRQEQGLGVPLPWGGPWALMGCAAGSEPPPEVISDQRETSWSQEKPTRVRGTSSPSPGEGLPQGLAKEVGRDLSTHRRWLHLDSHATALKQAVGLRHTARSAHYEWQPPARDQHKGQEANALQHHHCPAWSWAGKTHPQPLLPWVFA